MMESTRMEKRTFQEEIEELLVLKALFLSYWQSAKISAAILKREKFHAYEAV